MKGKALVILLLCLSTFSFGQKVGDTGVKTDTSFWKAVSMVLSNPDSSILLFQKCIEEYITQKNFKRTSLCYQGLATIYHTKKNFELEKNNHLKAYDVLFEYQAEYPEYFATAAFNLATFQLKYEDLNNVETTLNTASNALNGVKVPEDSLEFFRIRYLIFGQIGAVKSKKGDYLDAIKFYNLANDYSNKMIGVHKNNKIQNLNNIGSSFFYLQDFNKAKLFYKMSVRQCMNNKPVSKKLLIHSYQNLAITYLRLAKIDSVTLIFQKIDSILKFEKPSVYRASSVHQIKGEYYVAVDSLDKALSQFKKQLFWRHKELETYERRIKLFIQAHHQLAETYLKLGHADSALQIYQQALNKLNISPHNTATPYPLLAVPILDGKAQAHIGRYDQNKQQADLDTALWCYLTADSLVDQARDRLQNEGSKLFFSQQSRPIYERAIRFLLMMHQLRGEQSYLEQAFYFSERNKATLLFQSLQDAGAKLAAGLPDSLLEQERNLKVDIAFYQNKIFEAEQEQAATDSARLTAWRRILFDREEAYRNLSQSLEKAYPAYHQLKYDHKIVGAAELRSKLSASQLLLEFFEGDSAVYVFAIDKENIQVHQIARDSSLDKELQQLLSALQQPQKGIAGLQAFSQPAHHLFSRLLEPALRGKAYDQLLLIPDGQLSYLPFELLLPEPPGPLPPTDRKAERAYRRLPYLFRELPTRYAYSATLLFANPYRTQAGREEVAAFAPAYEGALYLSSNQPQAEAVTSLMGGTAFTGARADKATFLQVAPDFGLLHLAMHGEPDLYSPLRARLLFAGDDTTEAHSLYAYELYNLKLQAKMAVLAACESSYGKLEKSEGIYSLARAFRYAGCPSVVGSLWKADGHATTELMKAFYVALKEGDSKSQALRAAKEEYLQTAPNDRLHPYYWANFVVIGEDTPISRSYRLWLWLGMALLAGLLGYRWLRMRGRKDSLACLLLFADGWIAGAKSVLLFSIGVIGIET